MHQYSNDEIIRNLGASNHSFSNPLLINLRLTMSQLLAGKVAVITGGVTGIGRAIAIEYVRQGAKVVVNHLSDASSIAHYESLHFATASSVTCLHGVAGDISKPETATELIRVAVALYGKVDIFVSNAGVCKFTDFLTYDSRVHLS